MISKEIIQNNLTVKIASLIIGYGIWSFLGGIFVQNRTITVPIYFYNGEQHKNILVSPESVTVQLQGKRNCLKQCRDLAFHLDAASLPSGDHTILLSEEQLFMPKNITVLCYKPHAIHLSITEKS